MFPVWPEVFRANQGEVMFAWLVRLRWLALLGVAIILVLAGPVLGKIPSGSAVWLGSVAFALGVYNAALASLGPTRFQRFTSLGVQITVDCIALASLVHFAGGVENPFLPLFVLHVVNAGIVLSSRGALRVLGLSIVLAAAVVLAEGAGLVTHHCLHYKTGCLGGWLDFRALATLFGLVATWVTSSLFTRSLTARLRQEQDKLVATIAELNREKGRLAQAHAQVETERGRLQSIIDCMEDAVIFVEPGGNVIFSNQRAREIWRPESRAAKLADLAKLGSLDQTLEGGSGGRSPSTVSTFEHAGRAFEVARSLVRSATQEPVGVAVTARDITNRLAIEKRLMHDEQMSVVGKLAAAVAHEINNPIGVISLYSQHALASLLPDSPVHNHLQTIRRNAESCRKIVGGLLNLARPYKAAFQPVDLRQLCREVVDSVQPLAVGAGARIGCGAYKGEVPLFAKADAGMLRQAVLNLAVNALEAVGPGGEVSIRAYETQDGRLTARVIEVRDTGAGIAAGELDKIFQPFFTTKSSGTGLGLSIAENVVRSHGGRIDVHSVIGVGTTFRVTLPETADDDTSSAPRSEEAARTRENHP